VSEHYVAAVSPSALADRAETSEVFTRLLHQLDSHTKATDQIKETLDAARDAVGADVVCWHNEESGEILSTNPDHIFSPEKCRIVLQKLRAQHSGLKDSIIWHDRHGAPGKPHGRINSAAAVRIQRSRPGWILAVSSSEARPLDDCALRLIGLAGAMLLKHRQHSRIFAEFKESLLGLVRCLAAVIDAKDSCTAGHSERVSRIAVRIGKQLGLTACGLSDLLLAGLLHDVGKIGVRDEVLLKPGKLTADEEEHLRSHVVIGDQILSTIKPFGRLRPGVRAHHERFDGKGYPDGFAGKDIPLQGRILAVADACDAMISARRYRGPMPPAQIDAIFLENAGTQWDPKVIEAFMACRDAIYPPIYQKGIGESGALAIDRIVALLKEE
jgi:HD-GYP domain-containing protein (c-di-GMP phosphodiesterase class II)